MSSMKQKLGLFAVIRNRSNFVKEWILFHLMSGFDAVHLICDGCTEPTKERVLELPCQDKIFLHETSVIRHDDRQVTAYEFLMNLYGNNFEWAAFLDSDEFLFNPQGRDLRDVLAEFDDKDCSGVVVPWTIFGPNNHVLRPSGLIIDNFTSCNGIKDRTWGTIKSITKVDDIIGIGNVHYLNTRRPYVLENGEKFVCRGRCETDSFRSSKFRLNHYIAGSMEDWVDRTLRNGWGAAQSIDDFKGTLGKITNRDACIHSKSIRETLGLPLRDANLRNTVFVSTCDYPDADGISYNIRKTAVHFGVSLEWASYGERFVHLFDTKVTKLLRFLRNKQAQGMKYAFVLDARDVVFAAPVQSILDEFNLIYRGGVLFNADLKDKLWPLDATEMRWRIKSIHGANGIANSGVYCGEIAQVISLWDRLSALRDQLVTEMPAEWVARLAVDIKEYKEDRRFRHYLTGDFSRASGSVSDGTEYTSPLSTITRDLMFDDQLFVQIAQMDAGYPICVDTGKQLLACFDEEFPKVADRDEKEYDNVKSIGTAKILHSPWMSRYADDWKAWIETEVCR
ncbi:MAG TPA: hypothetical protein DEB39_16580 [Planctomycetaceae bacterium]|nr:hypothetical protein [Planctomycetaceae bacterium]